MNQETNICPHCEGYGFTIEIEAVCCENYNHPFVCCGNPNHEQVQVQCKCDNGFTPKSEVKEVKQIKSK